MNVNCPSFNPICSFSLYVCTTYLSKFESFAYYYHFLVFYCKSIFCDPSCESLNDAAVNEWRLTTPLQKIKKGMVIDSCAIFKLNGEERDGQKSTYLLFSALFFFCAIYLLGVFKPFSPLKHVPLSDVRLMDVYVKNVRKWKWSSRSLFSWIFTFSLTPPGAN